MAISCSSTTKSQNFSEKLTEDIDEYNDAYERIAVANGWNDGRKLIKFLLYFRNQTKRLFGRIEDNNGTLTWVVKKSFLDYYNPEEQIEILRENLTKKKKRRRNHYRSLF